MESFVVFILLAAIFGCGIITGNVTSTVDISQKEVIESNKLCKNSDKFTLKGETK